MVKITKTLILLLLFNLYSCGFKNNKQEYAETLIEAIDKFKQEYNRQPKDISELGLTEKLNNLAFYKMLTDSTYIVWYGVDIGESKVYNSSTKKWTN